MKKMIIHSDQTRGAGAILTALALVLPHLLVAQQTGSVDNVGETPSRAGVVEIRTPISTDFGTYVPYRVPTYQPSIGYSEPTLRADFANVTVPNGSFAWDRYFSAADRAALGRDRVALRPEPMGTFGQAYAGMNDQPEFAPFITTDAVMAGLHSTVDEAYRRARRDYLAPTLGSLLENLSRSINTGLSNESDPAMKEAFRRLLAWTETGRLLLDPAAVPQESVADEVRAELRKIAAGTSAASTILPDRKIDYSIFTPTADYALDQDLENYYRAKVWLSRVGLQLRTKSGGVQPVEARMAAILARAVDVMGERERDNLAGVVGLERFFAGRDANAVMPDVVAGAMRAYYGFQYAGSSSYLASEGSLQRLVDYLDRALPQNMNAADNLTMQLLPREATLGDALYETLRRSTGNKAAGYGQILVEALQKGENNEPKEVRNLRATLARLPMEDWVQDFEWTTLYTAQLLAGEEHSSGLPKFMQSNRWKERKVKSALGAWSAAVNGPGYLAATGGKGAAAETTRFAKMTGYVEPDPVAWSAIASHARYIREGLTGGAYGNVIGGLLEEKLRDIENTAAQFARIAALELAGKELTSDQAALVQAAPQHIAAWETFADPSLRGNGTFLAASAHPRAGGVGPATGHPMAIYVIVPSADEPGELVLTRGAVYSYHETVMGGDAWVRGVTTAGSAVDGAYVVPVSDIRPVQAKLPRVTAAVEESDRKSAGAGIQVNLESNVVRRSSGAVWYTVTAPGYDGADIVTTVVDAAGRQVFQSFPLPIEDGERYDMVPTEDMKAGHYFLRVSDITGRTLASGRFLLVQ